MEHLWFDSGLDLQGGPQCDEGKDGEGRSRRGGGPLKGLEEIS